MELIQKLPYSEQLEDILKRCFELLPKSTIRRAVLFGATAGVVVYLLTKKRYNLPPGPRGWPLLGNILELKDTTIYEKCIEWKRKYGPVMLIHAGPEAIVTLNSAEVFHEAMVKKQADFAGRPQSYSLGVMSDGFRNISLADYTPTWKLHRKLAIKAMRTFLGGTKIDDLVESSLKIGFDFMKKQENPFDPKSSLSLIVFNIINKMCFNFTCDANDPFYVHMMEWMEFDIGNGYLEDFFPPLRLFPSKKMKELMDLMDVWITTMKTQTEKHRSTFSRDNIRDFCDAMILAQEEAHEDENPDVISQITDRHLIQTVIDVFGAGIDTTRGTLIWCLKYLAGHPEIQDRLHKEVDQVLGSRRFPKILDRKNLSYTEAVLHETMRIAPLGNLTLPHTTTCDTKIGEYDIPKGTMVLGNIYAVHHDPEIWDEPEVYRPERFLDENGKFMSSRNKGWIPFSAGTRSCLAEIVAKPELHLLLAGIMRQFKVSPPVGEKLTYESTGSSFLFVSKSYKLVFESRS